MRVLWIPFSLALGDVHGRRLQDFDPGRFPDYQVQHGPMLRGRSPVEVRQPKYFHAYYKPTKAGEDSLTCIVLGVVTMALFGAGVFLKQRRKANVQSMVVKEAWTWVSGILPSLEKGAEDAMQKKNFDKLAQIEEDVHRFEAVLDSLDVKALVEANVFKSEAALKEARKPMILRTQVLLDRIDKAFPEKATKAPESAGPSNAVQGAGVLG